LDELGSIDLENLEHRRDLDHIWLQRERQGYLYLRDGQAVGYGYFGRRTGPVALLDESDFPAVIGLAESEAALKYEHFGLEVPGSNKEVLSYLLAMATKSTHLWPHC
jgi:hypothetical protein